MAFTLRDTNDLYSSLRNAGFALFFFCPFFYRFTVQSSRLSIQVNSFSRIGTKIWNEMPVSLRKLSKNAFKRKIKQTLFEILASEDCYIDLPEIVQKVKLNLFSS